jgi:ankyrin repeat protein
VEHPRNGRTPFQTIFVRLCWIDAGLEIEPTWQPGYKVNDRADYEGVMRQLLDNGADINKIEMENTDGWAVVHHAAYLGCYKRVKYFLENGGTVDLKTRDGVTALMKACEGGHLDVIMLLVYTNHDIKARSDTNLTLLHYAALSGNLNVIKFLLEAGADKMATDDDGRTALDICNARDYRVCAETLSKFAHPKPTMKPLIEYWKEVQVRHMKRALGAACAT